MNLFNIALLVIYMKNEKYNLKFIARCTLRLLNICLAWSVSLGTVFANDLVVTSPLNGEEFEPGDTITIDAQPDSALDIARVNVLVSLEGKQLEEVPGSVPLKYRTTYQIPSETSGELHITVIAFTADGDLLRAPDLAVNVIPSDVPVDLITHIDGRLEFVEGTGNTRQVTVSGVYLGDIHRSISASQFGTTYSSSDENVVVVDADGAITATGTGHAVVTVKNSGVTKYLQANVYGPNFESAPSQDVTNKVSISASGFRQDGETGYFTQEVYIHNNGSEPLPAPLHLVISDLPEGVDLINKADVTDSIEPVGSAVVWVVPNRLPPGETAKAQLTFANYDGRPIAYQRRLYLGSDL